MTRSNVEVFYPTGRNLSEWQAAYRLGEVPDLWPYGLNRLESENRFAVQANEAKPLRPLSLAQALIRGGKSQNRAEKSAVAIAWDEDLSLRLAAERPRTRKLAGLIWCTDRIARKELTFKDTILRRILPGFDGLWALSRAQLDVMTKWLGPGAPPIDFLRFGIDHEFFTSAPYPQQPLILSIGRDRDRDPETLFGALEEIQRLRPDVQIAVQTTSDQPAPKGIEVLPMLPHAGLRDYYRRASVVLVATKFNLHVSGMTVALESMATSRPVVANRTPGMDDYVEDGLTGLLYAPGDSLGMARGVLELLANPAAAAKMGQRGRQAVELRHTTQLMAESLLGLVAKRAT